MQQTNIRHGDFDLKVVNHVLVARLRGSWNEEAALAYENAFMTAAKPLTDIEWAHLVYLDDWDLGVPEIVPVVERLVAWCIDNGLRRSAQVYSPSMLKRYQLDSMVVEEFGDFQRRAFEQEGAAQNWLLSEGFSVD